MRDLDIENHLRDLERKQARRFLETPEAVTGFGDELAPLVRQRLERLVQIADFEEQN